MSDSADGSKGARRRRTVVLAEDDVALAVRLSEVFWDAGWVVVPAPEGDAVLRAFAAPADGAAPDALVYDAVLPGARGLELARTMRERFPAVPVLLLGSRATLSEREVEDAGVAAMLTNAGDFDALAAMLAYVVVERWKARRRSSEQPHLKPPPLELLGPVLGQRRREKRYPLDKPVPVRLRLSTEEQRREGELRDVSSRGICVRHIGSSLAIGTQLTLEYKPPGSLIGTVPLPCVVRWTQRVDNRNDAGLEFEKPESKYARALVYSALVDD